MKLIEIVVLMGAHCVSPVQHTTNATEAGKVHCAVVIEKDTQAGTLRIVPAGASREPEVVAVLNRLDTPTIAPVTGPPVSAAVTPAIAPPPALAPAPQPTVAEAPAPDTAAEAEQPVQEQKTAPKKIAEKPKPAQKQAERQDTKSKCRGQAKPKWYTNAEGRRKYRCVVPG